MSLKARSYEVVCGPELPIAQLVIGKRAEDAAALLPRLFNLCRAAQATAAAMAMGLPAPDVDLTGEIIRDHLMKLYVTWPRLLGLDPLPLPDDWQSGRERLLDQLFDAPFPETPDAFAEALAAGRGVASVFAVLDRAAPAGFGAAPALPPLDPAQVFEVRAVENSVAGRQADHPVLQSIEAVRERDLYWRAVARVYDLAAAVRGTLPPPRHMPEGHAVVAATRGTYAVRATVSDGIVTDFARITPTAHLLAENSILEITLSNLCDADQRTIALMQDILDPCSPVELRERDHA